MKHRKTPVKNRGICLICDQGAGKSARYEKYEYFLIALPVLLWQIVLIAGSNGLMPETDNYTHAMRLVDFIQSGSWAEIMYRHDNYPFGQILHFTRATDVFLYLTTLPFLPFLPLKQAVFYGCFLYQPVMAVASAVAVVWACRPFAGAFLRAAAAALYFMPLATYALFTAGRADHHVLLNLFLILIVGELARGFKTQRIAYFKAAGVFAGLSVWVSPEGFLATMAMIGGMVIAWVFRYQNMRQIFLFTLCFFLSMLACLAVNPPMQGFLFADNGRLSVLLAAVAGFAALSFFMAEYFEREVGISSVVGRLSVVALLTLFSMGFTLYLFGAQAVFGSPIAPELYDVWAKYITELWPAVLTMSALVKFDGLPLVACVCMALAFFFASFRQKKMMFAFGAALVFFAVLALISRRFGRPAGAFAPVIVVLSLRVWYDRARFWKKESVRSVLAVPAVFFPVSLFFAFATLSYDFQIEWQSKTTPEDFIPYLSKEKGSILAASSRGPEIAWLTEIPVVGSPYHSNAEGILDTAAMLHGYDMVKTRRLLEKHQVKTILLDDPYYTAKPELRPFVSIDPMKLIGRLLVTGKLPCFVKRAQGVPAKSAEKYHIFHVDFSGCDSPARSL